MSFPLTYTVNLTTEEISAFVLDTTKQKIDGPIPAKPGYINSAAKLVGIDDTTPLNAQIREYYELICRNSVVSTFNVIIPIIQKCKISITALLYIKDHLSDDITQKIIRIFNAFDPAGGIDPNQYIREQLVLNPTIADDFFDIDFTFSIDKNNIPPIEYRDQIDRIKALYDGTDTTSIIVISGTERTVSDFLRRRGYSLKLIRTEKIIGIVQQNHDPMHEIESTTEDSPKIDDVMNEEAANLDCHGIVIDKGEVCKLQPPIPEIRTTPVWRKVKIGCVEVPYPWFTHTKVRLVWQYLWYSVGRPNSLPQTILMQVEACAVGSAIAGVVVGIVFANFEAALYSFKALFNKCITDAIEDDIYCILPDLFLVSVPEPWHDL